jgi:uncharacterized protein YdeI (YjbR/CyaY-like superfamily)
MPTTDKRVDAYIAKAGEFARPILSSIRKAVHDNCPDCEETLKWGHPAFMHNGLMLIMASFKEHVAVNFWKAKLILGKDGRPDEAFGNLGRIETLADLPPKQVFAGYIKKAAELNDTGTPVPKPKSKPKPKLAVPSDLKTALEKNKKAFATFEKLSPSHQREYVEWIVEAKRDETRARRVAQAVEMMAEGKSRNWKYG